MNELQKAEECLIRFRMKYLCVNVTYIRTGNAVAREFKALPVSRKNNSAEMAFIAIQKHSTDFLFDSRELDFIPQRGDKIIWNTDEYTVMPSQTQDCWEYTGIFKTGKRVHTIATTHS